MGVSRSNNNVANNLYRPGSATMHPLLAALSLILVSTASAAVTTVPVYRLAHYSVPPNSTFGSVQASLTMTLTSRNFLRMDDITPEIITNITDPSFRTKGMLFIVPHDLSSDHESFWRYLERKLLTQKVSFPVYFANETDELNAIYKTVQIEGTDPFLNRVLTVRGSSAAITSPKVIILVVCELVRGQHVG